MMKSVDDDLSTEITPSLEVRAVPIGITIQLNYVAETWNVGTINNMTVNQGRVIGDRTLFSIFKTLLEKHNLSIEDLNKDTSYTFLINTKDLQVVPSSDYIYLRNASRQDKVTKAIPSLKKMSIKFDHLGVPILPNNYFE